MKSLMWPGVLILAGLVFTSGVRIQARLPRAVFDDDPAASVENLEKKVEAMSNTIAAMSRQMMLQQLFAEERIRSDADSGIKQVRHNQDGTRNYHAATHTTSSRVVSIHDHSNNDRTVGMGEFIAVLNGVEFRTRHNDYRLYMPNRTSSAYHEEEPIPFPDVPPEVLAKNGVNNQIKEMREWFKAWRDQNHSVRDYRKYFRPVLCYLEGAWTNAEEGAIDEPFQSDRHFIDASSWFDLQEKIRFTSYTGRKDNLENFSFLPTTIMNVTNGSPQFAQWNYRILCHPISRDLPLNRLRMVDELAPRMTAQRTYEEQVLTRAARFQLNPFDQSNWVERINGRRWGLLDKLMSEIPGKDNYQGKLTDEAFGLSVLNLAPGKEGQKLNAARYHRWFKVGAKGAMGTSTRHRGFADENLFMAMTTQPKVAGMTMKSCRRPNNGGKKKCNHLNQKFSYAIPLEIIFLTPLSKWNPYDIEYKGAFNSALGKTVEAGGRNGGNTKAKAFKGTNSKKFYQTPVEFFSGGEIGTDAADTTKNSVGVLDKKGNLRFCKASGTRIFFPSIPGVGILRQRYPIMPVHGEGSAVWKELEAVKDLILKSKTFGYVFREQLQAGPKPTEPPRKPIKLEMEDAIRNPPGPHKHEITLQPDQVDFIKGGKKLTVTTNQRAAHDHDVRLRWNAEKEEFEIDYCDDDDKGKYRCWDKHPRFFTVIDE